MDGIDLHFFAWFQGEFLAERRDQLHGLVVDPLGFDVVEMEVLQRGFELGGG